MIAGHIHDALAQVRRLQELILDKQFFRGYSGKARLLSGAAALAGAIVMGSDGYPGTAAAHLKGWGTVLAVGLLVNYVSLAYWFLFDPAVRRKPRMLKPAADAVPALLVGAALSAALIAADHHDLLFGVWLCLYGLSQIAYRRSLPGGIHTVGLAYVAAGLGCLLAPSVSFENPWPMAIPIAAGEFISGVILIRAKMADVHAVHEGHAERMERNNG